MLTKTGAKLLDFGLAQGRRRPSSAIVARLTEIADAGEAADAARARSSGPSSTWRPSSSRAGSRPAHRHLRLRRACSTRWRRAGAPSREEPKTSLIAAIISREPPPISVGRADDAAGARSRRHGSASRRIPTTAGSRAHDVASELRWISEAGSQAGVATTVTVRRKSRERIAWTLAALLAIADGHHRVRPRARAAAAACAPHDLGAARSDDLAEGRNVAVSPDGNSVVFVGSDVSGRGGLWVRSLPTPRRAFCRRPTTRPTRSGRPTAITSRSSPRESSSGSRSRGRRDEICAAADGRGGAWGSRGVIVFAPTVGSPLMRVAADGGEPVAVTALDPSKKEDSHRFPSFLPGGERFLFYSMDSGGAGNIKLGSLESPKSTQFLKARTERGLRRARLHRLRQRRPDPGATLRSEVTPRSPASPSGFPTPRRRWSTAAIVSPPCRKTG